ncbi:DUF1566 domain-containing protein [bacterium]|nr:DUF1566 domain-containing protein [bacterium]
MRNTPLIALVCFVAAVFFAADPLGAATTPAENCEAHKLVAAGHYADCRLKEDAKAAKSGAAADYAKCGETLIERFESAENAFGAACPTIGDAADVIARVAAETDALALLLSGQTPPAPAECGNGILEGAEACEVGDLDGASCESEGFAGGALACDTGCTFDTGGCYATRFVDNGDGSVTDNGTGLTWEQKTTDSSIHDVLRLFIWSTPIPGNPITTDGLPDGTLFTSFLWELNGTVSTDGTTIGGCFAGHCDWRLPTVEELKTIHVARVDPIFGPTRPEDYWTGTEYPYDLDPEAAWRAYLGGYYLWFKAQPAFARAVRGPLWNP